MAAEALDRVINWSLKLTFYSLHIGTWLRRKCSRGFSSLVQLFIYSWKKLLIKNEEVNVFEVARNDSKRLEKIPKHYAAALLEDQDFAHRDLSRIAVWCFAFGIQQVSLYEPTGKLKQDLDLFKAVLMQEYQSVFGPMAPSLSVSSVNQAHSRQGGIVESTYRVHLWSRQDSQHHLARTAQDLCSSIQSGPLRASDITVDTVEQKWKELGGVSEDPDLLVAFGNMCTTGGFPVWMMRFSEVHTLETHRFITYKDFLSSLQAFAKCKQNFGK